MIFTEEEVFYLKKLLFNHSLDLTDLLLNEKDKREFAREILKINHSCMDKISSL